MAEGGIGLDAILCDLCEKEPAQFFCRTCDGNLCVECKIDHKSKKMFLRHDVAKMTLTRKMEMEGYGYCNEHPECKYELSCQACALPVCTKCIAGQHNGHKMTDISSTYLEVKRKMSTIVNEIDETLLPKYRRNLDVLEAVLSDVKKTTRDLEHTIVDRSRNLTDIIQSVEKEFLKKICNDSKSCNEIILAQKNDIESHITSLQKLQNALIEKRDSLGMTELILYMISNLNVSDRNPNFPPLSFQPASFFSNACNENSLRVLFGLVFPFRMSVEKTEKRIMSRCIEITRISTSVKLPIGLFLATDRDVVWVRGEDALVQKINMQGNVISTISTQTEIGRPSGLIEMENEIVWYTDLENKKIKKVSNNLDKEDNINTEWHPMGMCRSQSGHILVCVASLSVHVKNESDVGKILRMDCNGNIFQEIQKNNEDQNLFIRPICVTENINQDICVSDCKIHAVIVVDRTGLFRFSYDGGLVKKEGIVFSPTELDHDSAGNIIVCDHSNNLIHLVDINGSLSRHILTEKDGIVSPRGLKVDSEDRLWFTEDVNGCIKVVQYLE